LPSRRRLKTSSDIRKYLANVILRMDAGELNPAVGTKLGYVSNILLRAIQGDEVEGRLEALEAKLGKP